MRRISGTAIVVAAACVVTAVVLANVLTACHSAPPVTKNIKQAHHPAGPTPIAMAPYYVAINGNGGATVRATANGAKIATVRPPRGLTFDGVAGSENDTTFVLAAKSASASRFYELQLNSKGRPGPLAREAVPSLPRHFGNCPTQLAGLAVNPDGRLLAISLLSNCPTGRAGPGEILTVRLASGHALATFRPGDGYPQSLSWTLSDGLAYGWTGSTTGAWLIPDAIKPGASRRMLISDSSGVDGLTYAYSPLITPDGSAVIATVGSGTKLAIAEFSVRTGKARWLLIRPVHSPAQYCGPLWTDTTGRGQLVGCGDNAEFEIQNRQLTKLAKPWQLPIYNVPTAPLIAW